MKKYVIARDVPGPFQHRGRPPRRAPALVRRRPLSAHQVLVSVGGRVLVGTMGRSGIATLKREGDGGTPRCRITPELYFFRAKPRVSLPSRRINGSDGWCDDPGSARYNAHIKVPAGAGHERLLRSDELYDHLIVTDHNARPRIRRGGSAIFIHVARPAMTPTEGCIAFPLAAWQRGTVPVGPYLVGVDPRAKAKR